MAGVRDRFANEEEMALAALTAGVDMLLDISDAAKVVDFLSDCVSTGRLDAARVDEAFERVWAIKQKSFDKRHGTRRRTSGHPKRLAGTSQPRRAGCHRSHRRQFPCPAL